MHLLPAVQDGTPGQLTRYRGLVDAGRSILKQDGVRGLYAGTPPPHAPTTMTITTTTAITVTITITITAHPGQPTSQAALDKGAWFVSTSIAAALTPFELYALLFRSISSADRLRSGVGLLFCHLRSP